MRKRTIPIAVAIFVAMAFFCKKGYSEEYEKPLKIYVSPNGSDKASGLKDAPFASIQKAWEVVCGDNSFCSFEILLEDGRYELAETIDLHGEKQGDKQVAIKAIHPKKVIIAGGKQLPKAAWVKIKKGKVFQLLNNESRKYVWQIDLKNLSISDYGTMKGRGFSQNVLPMEMELFCNNKRMQLARWPNYDIDAEYEGKAQYGKVVEIGSKPRFGEAEDNPAKFIFENERIKNWTKNDDVWVQGVWSWDWADRRMKLLDVDTKKSELTVGCSYYGMKPEKYFYVVNAVAELDSPGEYYIDRENGILYFWPLVSIDQAEISVSMIEEPLLVLENTTNVSVQDIVFQEGRSVGINIVGGANNLIENCIIREMGSAAVNIGEGQQDREIIGIGYGGGNTGLYERTGWNRNGGTNNGVRDCEIYDIAAYGILLGGGDRKTLTPAENFVENCNIHHVARVYEQMFSNVHIDGVGNRVSNCDLSFNPHSAIMFWGNDHIIEYNEIHHCVYNSSDAGAIYTGRDPSQTGTVIRWNLFHHIYGNEDFEGVFFDDGASGLTVDGNIFYDIQSRGATKYHGGQNNIFTNNIVVDCSRPVEYQLWNQSKWNDFLKSDLQKERLYKSVNIFEEPYLSAYPWLTRMFDVPYDKNSHVEERNYLTSINDPLFENGKELDFRVNDWKTLREKVPGIQIIPVERIGLKEKPRRLLSPVYYMKTSRLFPGNTVEIGHAKTIEGKAEYEIFYTLDGTEPDRASIKYTEPIVMDKPGVIKSRIYQIGLSDDLASNVKTLRCEEPDGTIFLDELYPTHITAHNGLKLKHNYGFSNRAILDGNAYMHSVMACPTSKEKQSKLVYDLSFIKGEVSFKSDYGLDAATKFGSVVFIVKASKNGKVEELFRSSLVDSSGVKKSLEVDVSGYDELILIATDGGDGPAGDHSVWANARLEINRK